MHRNIFCPTRPIFSANQLYYSRLSVDLLWYDWIAEKKLDGYAHKPFYRSLSSYLYELPGIAWMNSNEGFINSPESKSEKCGSTPLNHHQQKEL